MPQIIRRQSSDPYFVERHEYYDGQNSVIEERMLERPSRPVSRASFGSDRVLEAPERRPYTRREESHSEKDVYARPTPRRQVFEEGDWYASRNRNRRASRGRNERSRSRLSTYVDGDDYPVHPPPMLRAPSPPPIDASPLGYLESRRREDVGRRGRLTIDTSRRRSRSRSLAGPGDNITMVGRHTNKHEYDTFDRDGMKVRVREI